MPLYPNTDSYAHRYFCILIILPFRSAATVSLRFINWTAGKGYINIKGKFMQWIAFCWPKTLNIFFVCYFCATYPSYKTINIQLQPKEYEIYLNTKKICMREKYFIRPLKFIWNTRIYIYIYIYIYRESASRFSCHLCLTEKLYLVRAKKPSLLNKRTELISKCLHENNY